MSSIRCSPRQEGLAGSFLPKLVLRGLGICKERCSLWEECFHWSSDMQGCQANQMSQRVAWVHWFCSNTLSWDFWVIGGPLEDHLDDIVFLLSQQQKLLRSLPPNICTSQKPKRMSRELRQRWLHSRTWDTPLRVVSDMPYRPLTA